MASTSLESSSPTTTYTQLLKAYRRLTRSELKLFISLRGLVQANDEDDVEEWTKRLAQYDMRMYVKTDGSELGDTDNIDVSLLKAAVSSPSPPPCINAKPMVIPTIPYLPTEIVAIIIDSVQDWRVSHAVGLPTSLHPPSEWAKASASDKALLCGHIPLLRSSVPTSPPTRTGVTIAIRFAYINALEYLLRFHRALFVQLVTGDLIPLLASTHGRTSVLSWYSRSVCASLLPAPPTSSIAACVDNAARAGSVATLDWWLCSPFPFHHTDSALESASAKNHIHVLQWFLKNHQLLPTPLKIGRVLETASSAGHVEVLSFWLNSGLELKYDKQAMHNASLHGRLDVLDWWLNSGLQLIFDQDALVIATRYNKPEVLEWWDQSGLPVSWRMCDIEEALEDATGGGEGVREWWRKKGVDFNANDAEWMKLRSFK